MSAATPEAPAKARRCRICGEDISHRRSDAQTCSDADRKVLERLRDNNGYVLCELDLEELAFDRQKRKTSERRDAKTGVLDEAGVSSNWDEIDRAWRAANVWRPSQITVPLKLDDRGRRLGKLRDVDRLMGEAEAHRHKADSPGRLPKVSLHNRMFEREDSGSPGALWERDESDGVAVEDGSLRAQIARGKRAKTEPAMVRARRNAEPRRSRLHRGTGRVD